MNKHYRQQGYALIIVLWLTTLLTIIAGIAYNSARTEIQLTAFHTNQIKGTLLTEAGIWLTINKIVSTGLNSRMPIRAFSETVDFSNNNIEISVQDLSSLININYAPPELLSLLLSSTTLGDDEIQAVIQAIATRKPLATVDELRLVDGMTDIAYRQIAPYLTIFGQHEQLNILDADINLVKIITGLPLDQISIFQQSLRSGESSIQLPNLNRRIITTTATNLFIIRSDVTVNAIWTSYTAIIKVTGRRRVEPYQVLAWNKTGTINQAFQAL